VGLDPMIISKANFEVELCLVLYNRGSQPFSAHVTGKRNPLTL